MILTEEPWAYRNEIDERFHYKTCYRENNTGKQKHGGKEYQAFMKKQYHKIPDEPISLMMAYGWPMRCVFRERCI